MMFKIFCVFYLLLFTNHIHAQIIDASETETKQKFVITSYMTVLKSRTAIPLDTVLSANGRNRFEKAEDKPVVFAGYDPYYYWFKMIIRNHEAYPKELSLLMGPIGMRMGQLYQHNNNKWQVIAKNGMSLKFAERSYQSAYYVFPFRVNAQTTDTLYLSMDASHKYKSYGFVLMEPKALKMFENKVYFAFGIIVGLLLLFCIFNLYMYFTLNEIVHLWYSLYIAFLFLIVMKNDQLDQQFFKWDSERAFTLTPMMTIAAIAIAILMHVIRYFLVNIDRNNLLYKISMVAKVNVFISGIVHLVVVNIRPDYHIESFVFVWTDTSTILGMLIIIVDCIYSIVHGFKSAYYILAGLLVFLIGAIQRLLFTSTLSYLSPPSVFHIGIVLETLIISFGLIYRYRLDRKERNLYLKEKEDLKNNFDKMILESKLEIQEQTFRNISREIHDNIGQVLSLVKLNLSNVRLDCNNDPGEKLKDSNNLLSKAISDLRSLSKSLDSDYVMDMGLPKSIAYELEQLKKLGGFDTKLNITGEINRIEPQKELIIFRIFQEVLNNIIKHATASAVKVKLSAYPKFIELTVSDNGKGFEVVKVNGSGSYEGQGLRNMHKRATLIGADFEINSGQNGTSVRIKLPIHKS